MDFADFLCTIILVKNICHTLFSMYDLCVRLMDLLLEVHVSYYTVVVYTFTAVTSTTEYLVLF